MCLYKAMKMCMVLHKIQGNIAQYRHTTMISSERKGNNEWIMCLYKAMKMCMVLHKIQGNIAQYRHTIEESHNMTLQELCSN